MTLKHYVLLLCSFITGTFLLNATVLTRALAAHAHAQASNPSASTAIVVAQASPSLIERTWQAEGDHFQVQIFKEKNVYNGKIVWLPPGAETTDVKNPNASLRSRSLLGLVILKGFTYNTSQNQWAGGTLYIPDMGRAVRPKKLWMEGPDQLKMQISMGLMTRTLTLTAVK